MGMLFQFGALFTDMNVFDNVAFPLREHTDLPEDLVRDIVLMKLEAVGLRGARDLLPSEISGGMARRVALALVQRYVPLFADLNALQLREFMLDSEVVAPAPGTVIFRKDDYTNSFFSVVDGEVLIEILAEDGTTKSLTLRRGQFFGEMGLLSGRRRTSTVKIGRAHV